MTLGLFLGAFGVLAVADWYMDMVQRTTVLICRANDVPVRPLGEFLTPRFVRAALAITLLKWGLVAYYAWTASVAVAVGALVLGTVISVASLVRPATALTVPAIRRQIAFVATLDRDLASNLSGMLLTWERRGGRF